MNSSTRASQFPQALTACVLLLGTAPGARGEPPSGATPDGAANPTAAEGPDLAPHGSFLSSLKQGFGQDLEHEVVRGHFDVTSASGTQRYYCLINPKTGKLEENGVSGQPVTHRDGTTGIKAGAVSFYRCSDAEQKGMLVTSGYLTQSPGAAQRRAAPAPPGTPQAALPAAAPAPSDVMAVYDRFIAGQNARDRAAISELLLNSHDFVWTEAGRTPVWGREAALDAFERDWKDMGKLEPQAREMRVAEVSPGVALLVTPLRVTGTATSEGVGAVPLTWSGVFVKTKAGWRIASIFTAPLATTRTPSGD